MDEKIRFKIVHALTEHDRKQSTKKGYNPYALGIYLDAVHHIDDCVKRGISLEDAICDAFCGRLLTLVLKAAGIKRDPNKGDTHYVRQY